MSDLGPYCLSSIGRLTISIILVMISALEFLLVCILGYGKDIWIQYFEVVVWFCNHKAVNTLYSSNWYLTDLFCVFFGKLQQSFSPESCVEV